MMVDIRNKRGSGSGVENNFLKLNDREKRISIRFIIVDVVGYICGSDMGERNRIKIISIGTNSGNIGST